MNQRFRYSIFPAVLAGLLWLSGGRARAQEEGTAWLDNYKQAIAEAARTGKPIFLEYRCEA